MALCRDLGEVSPGSWSGPIGLKLAGIIGHRCHLHQGTNAAWPQKMSFHLGVGSWVVLTIANIGGDSYGAVIEQHLSGDRSYHVTRSIGNQPSQKLLPEQIVSGVAERQAHLPTPTAPGGHDRRT